MRPAEKSSFETKAPLKVKGGVQVRLPIKKMYCTKCQRLVKAQIQGSGSATQINCPRCTQNLWKWESLSWRSTGNGS